MLARIRLRFGSSTGQPEADFAAGPVTVLVGPNNSGKSLALREIETLLGNPDAQPLIIRSLEVRDVDQPSLDALIMARGRIEESMAVTPATQTASITKLRPGTRGPAAGQNYSFMRIKTDGDWTLNDNSKEPADADGDRSAQWVSRQRL